MVHLLIGQPSIFNHHHSNYHTIAHSHSNTKKISLHAGNTSCSSHTPHRSITGVCISSERNEKEPVIWTIHMQFALFSHYLLLSAIQICTDTLVHCKISSISSLLSFSLWMLYLTITCNDRDITIMIMAFANAALSTHAHPQAVKYIQNICLFQCLRSW